MMPRVDAAEYASLTTTTSYRAQSLEVELGREGWQNLLNVLGKTPTHKQTNTLSGAT